MPRNPEFFPPEIGEEKSEKRDLVSLKQEVLQHLEENKAAAESIKDPEDRNRAYCSIAMDESRIGVDPSATFLLAKETAGAIQDKNGQQDALRDIANRQAHCHLFDDAKLTAKGIRYIFQRNLAYRDISHEEAEAGLFDQAIETIKHTGEGIDLRLVKKSIQEIKDAERKEKTKQHLPIEYFEEKQKKIKTIKDNDKRDMQYFNLGLKAAGHGHIQKAKELAESIIEPALRGSGLMDISGYEEAMSRASETEEERLLRIYKEILEEG